MKSLPGLIWLVKSWLQNLSNSKEYKKLPLKQLYVCVCVQFNSVALYFRQKLIGNRKTEQESTSRTI